MIRVSVKTQNENIISVIVSGHAQYADSGKDVVCAGVSSVAVGLLNALDMLAQDSCNLELHENKVVISVKEIEDKSQMILKVGLIQLETIQTSYQNYIIIDKQEV